MRSVKELLWLWVKSYGITVHSGESSQNAFFVQLNIYLNINVYFSAHVHRNLCWLCMYIFSFIQQFWQVLSSSFYYSSTRNLICGSFLLYTFRIFERRFGSRKYAVSNSMKFTFLQYWELPSYETLNSEITLKIQFVFSVLFLVLYLWYHRYSHWAPADNNCCS